MLQMAKSAITVILLIIGAILLGCTARSAGDSAEDNNEWKYSVKTDISFPLSTPITITVGIRSQEQAGEQVPDIATNVSLQWLEELTNIHLEFQPLVVSAAWRMVDFPEMVREGTLPDLLQESIIGNKDDSVRALFVNVLDFPELTPNFNNLLKNDELFLMGTLSRLEGDNELYSLGSYAPEKLPYMGAIAFREDIFVNHHLEYETWSELLKSLRYLKESFPESYPIGVTPESIFFTLPSWFGTGYHPVYACYYHPEKKKWIFGPYEREFEEYVRYFATLYEENLIHPYTFNPPPGRNYPTEDFLLDQIFVAYWSGTTGLSFRPHFRFLQREYGGLTQTGDWDKNGVWISAMKIPENRAKKRGWISPRVWKNVTSGWLVSRDSAYVGELLAFCDLLFDPKIALTLQLGPEGLIWDYKREWPVLKPFIKTPGNPDGEISYADYLREENVTVGIPIIGLQADLTDLFGLKSSPLYKYHRRYEIDTYYGQGSVMTQPLPKLIADNRTMTLISSTQARIMRIVETELMKFIMGSRSMDEYDLFLEELKDIGTDRLVEMLNNNSVESHPEILLEPISD